jgi:hypothetical protein
VLVNCTQHNLAVSRLQVEEESPTSVEDASDRTITVALEI